MKKLFLVVLLIVCMFMIVSCSQEQPEVEQLEIVQEQPVEETQPVVEEQVAPEPPAVPVEQKPVKEVAIVEETVLQPTLVHECGELKAGKYVLAVDILATGRELYTPCITLSSDTSLDCNGHRIYKTGVDEGQGVGIKAANVHDIVVENCHVENFRDGIDVVNSKNVKIAFNHVSNQKRDGIRIFDGSEIQVMNNTLRANSQSGFFLNTSMAKRSWVADVYFNGNDACGNLDRDYKCIGNFVVSGKGNYFERMMECRLSNGWPTRDKEYTVCHERNSLRARGWD